MGRLACYTLPDGSSVCYDYEEAHLRYIERRGASGRPLYKHAYLAFDANGHVCYEELPFVIGKIETQHDLLERPCRSLSRWMDETLAYGLTGLIAGRKNTLLGDKAYIYDALSQLICEGAEMHSFDGLGNPLAAEFGASGQLLAMDAVHLAYDPNDNPMGEECLMTWKKYGCIL